VALAAASMSLRCGRSGGKKKEKRDICRDQAATPIRGDTAPPGPDRAGPACIFCNKDFRSSAVPGACLRKWLRAQQPQQGLGRGGRRDVMLSHHERRPTTSQALVPAARRVELRDPRDGVAKARRCAGNRLRLRSLPSGRAAQLST